MGCNTGEKRALNAESPEILAADKHGRVPCLYYPVHPFILQYPGSDIFLSKLVYPGLFPNFSPGILNLNEIINLS